MALVLAVCCCNVGEKKVTRMLKTQSQVNAHLRAAEETPLARALRFFRVPALRSTPYCYQRDDNGKWEATDALKAGKSCRAPAGRPQIE